MFEITNYPKGLTSLLSLKQQGRGPSNLSETVAPIIDVTNMYLLSLREYVSMGSQPNPVVGSNNYPTPVVVPAGELWYVWQYLVSSSPGAGEACDIAPAVALDGNPLSVPLVPYVAAAANQDGRAASNVPFWAGPGTLFQFQARSLTLQPDVFGAAIVTKLRV